METENTSLTDKVTGLTDKVTTLTDKVGWLISEIEVAAAEREVAAAERVLAKWVPMMREGIVMWKNRLRDECEATLAPEEKIKTNQPRALGVYLNLLTGGTERDERMRIKNIDGVRRVVSEWEAHMLMQDAELKEFYEILKEQNTSRNDGVHGDAGLDLVLIIQNDEVAEVCEMVRTSIAFLLSGVEKRSRIPAEYLGYKAHYEDLVQLVAVFEKAAPALKQKLPLMIRTSQTAAE